MGMARNRFLSLLLLSLVAALVSGVFLSASSDDLKEKIKGGGCGNILRHAGSEGPAPFMCCDLIKLIHLHLTFIWKFAL